MANTENKKRGTVVSAKTLHGEDGKPYGISLAFPQTGENHMLTFAELSDEIRLEALAHGLKAKCVDAAAIARNPQTGGSASPADKRNAVMEVHGRLLAGQWNARGAADGEKTDKGGLLHEALCRLYAGKKSPAEITAYLDTKSAAEQAVLRADPRIAPKIAEIKAERAAKKAESGKPVAEELLSELESGEWALSAHGSEGDTDGEDEGEDEDTPEREPEPVADVPAPAPKAKRGGKK